MGRFKLPGVHQTFNPATGETFAWYLATSEEDVFGPLASVIRAESLDEALEVLKKGHPLR